jgi:starch phosphorylase
LDVCRQEESPVWAAGDFLDASSLYEKLERTILPFFYRDRENFTDGMIHSIAINGSFFNARGMNVLNAYYAR